VGVRSGSHARKRSHEAHDDEAVLMVMSLLPVTALADGGA